MSDWVLVPSLVALRAEFDAVAPKRDHGSDGSIGNGAHLSSSDHTPDEDSAVLRDHDADSKNEVHALDIDSTGPWPGSVTDFSAFNLMVLGIVERERKRWLDPNDMCRLNYVIWNKMIADKDIDNFAWKPYTATSDDHTGHAHFSARYETAAENDTSPWGVKPTMAAQDVRDYFESAAKAIRDGGNATTANRTDRDTLAAVFRYAWGLGYTAQTGDNLAPARLDRVDAAIAEIKAGSGVVDTEALATAVVLEFSDRLAH